MPRKWPKAMREADARYEAKRRRRKITVPLNEEEQARFETLRTPGEPDATAMKRLAGIAKK